MKRLHYLQTWPDSAPLVLNLAEVEAAYPLAENVPGGGCIVQVFGRCYTLDHSFRQLVELMRGEGIEIVQVEPGRWDPMNQPTTEDKNQ